MHTRHSKILSATYALLLSAILCGCGLYTPEKDVFSKDTSDGAGYTTGGGYESSIVDHVTCEIAQGLRESEKLQLPWLTGAGETQPGWGVTVTQTITVEDQGGVAPGITLINPLQNAVFHFVSGGNVVSAQSFLFNVGATASANSLRTETIQYTFRNKDILNLPRKACTQTSSGVAAPKTFSGSGKPHKFAEIYTEVSSVKALKLKLILRPIRSARILL